MVVAGQDDARDDAMGLAAVVAATGFSADLLRAWQRRYGFPVPLRDPGGHRRFPLEQVQRLRLLRRLIDAGERPASVVALPLAELEQRLSVRPATGLDADVALALDLLAHGAFDRLADHVAQTLARLGAAAFVLRFAAPLVAAVGEGWHARQIAVFQEHAVSQILERTLAQAARALSGPAAQGPRVMLTTCPGEAHGLGLAMAEVVLAAHGAHCTALGLQTPLEDIGAAAALLRADVVALSFSSFSPPRRAQAQIAQVRAGLPAGVALWVGGTCAALRQPLPDGVTVLAGLDAIAPALAAMQTAGEAAPLRQPLRG